MNVALQLIRGCDTMVKENNGANKTRGFIVRNYKKIYIVVISMMCFLLILCIIRSFDLHILRNTVAAVNTLIDIVLMVFLLLLFGFSASDKYVENKQNIVFSLLIVVDFLMLFFSTLGYAVYGLPEKSDFIRIATTISYLLWFISFAVLWKYQCFFYKKTVAVKISTYIIYLTVLFYMVLTAVNMFMPVLFDIDKKGLYDMEIADNISPFVGVLLVVVMYINVLISDCDLKKKIALASYEVAPAIMIILSIMTNITYYDIYLPSLADVAVLFPLYIIFYSIYLEQKNEIEHKEVEKMKMETSLMLSQIQPHFLYNCLSTIAELCEEDSVLAEKATTTFADYLRENMDCIGSETTISFSSEMEHIIKYVWLEKLRFGDRVNVEYDLSCIDFSIPALTVQPLVENAIKHGLCKKKGGGTVRITSYDDGNSYKIIISDDGVGFDPLIKFDDKRQHIGIENVRKRLKSLADGSLMVETAPEKGTSVTINLPKSGGEK